MKCLAVTRVHQRRTMCAPQLGPRTEKREFPARLLELSFGGASTGMYMTKRDKPHLVSVPGGLQPAPNGRALLSGDQLRRDVVECLDKWRQWAPATERGLLTPMQFLAVVLWMLGTSDTTEADEKLIVDRWAAALLRACVHPDGIVVGLHPVSLLPLEQGDSPLEWVLSVAHAEAFLRSVPVGFDIRSALQFWRDQAAQPLGGKRTLEQVAEHRKAVKGTRWCRADKQVVADAVAETEGVQNFV